MESKNLPTFKTNKGYLFYNPGDRVLENIAFSIPGQGDIHAIANWTLDAQPESFFRVPTELRFTNGDRINVDFPATVLLRFKDRGVILVDDEWEVPEDEELAERLPMAKTEEEAKAKGERHWLKYIEKVVRTHIENCDRARAVGGFPREAQGFTKRAFKLLNMVDPAEKGFESYKAAQAAPVTAASAELQSVEAQTIRKELDATKEMLAKVLRLLAAREDTALDEQIESQVATGAAPAIEPLAPKPAAKPAAKPAPKAAPKTAARPA
jgi:hypothetical protein